jgi:predicted aspartyl protease
MKVLHLTGIASILVATVPLSASGQTAAGGTQSETPPQTETIALAADQSHRMTVPVSIGGRGPFSFVVDTGAERTVISRELARVLGLDPGEAAIVSSMTEVSSIGTVVIPNLNVGHRRVSGIEAPALSESDLGAQGLLGLDSLQSQRVVLDFVDHQMTVTPSSRDEEHWDGRTIVVTARKRHGHLMLVNASFEGERVYVIVDTGSQITVGNSALRERLARHHRLGEMRPVQLISVTGGTRTLEYSVARQIMLGDAGIRNLPVAFADVAPFRELDLADRPAILLGMDALRLFDRVSFDFANKRVRFQIPGSSQRRLRDVQMARTVLSARLAG